VVCGSQVRVEGRQMGGLLVSTKPAVLKNAARRGFSRPLRFYTGVGLHLKLTSVQEKK